MRKRRMSVWLGASLGLIPELGVWRKDRGAPEPETAQDVQALLMKKAALKREMRQRKRMKS